MQKIKPGLTSPGTLTSSHGHSNMLRSTDFEFWMAQTAPASHWTSIQREVGIVWGECDVQALHSQQGLRSVRERRLGDQTSMERQSCRAVNYWGLRSSYDQKVVTRGELQRARDLHSKRLTMELLCARNPNEACRPSATVQTTHN